MRVENCDNYDEAKRMVEQYTSNFHHEVISSKEICELQLFGKIILIDVRTEEEMAISTLPNALSAKEFEKSWQSRPLGDYTIVPYCTVGYRSGNYCTFLTNIGFLNVKNGEGIVMWTHSGQALQKKGDGGAIEPTFRVHTFGSKWNLISGRFQAVYFSDWQVYWYGIGYYIQSFWKAGSH